MTVYEVGTITILLNSTQQAGEAGIHPEEAWLQGPSS